MGRLLDVGKKLKEVKQRPKQSVSVLAAHIDSLEDQLPQRPPEYIRASHLMFALHDYIQKAGRGRTAPENGKRVSGHTALSGK